MNGIGPASLTTWLIDGLTPANIERTLRHVATGWLALTSANAVCVWWQPQVRKPAYACATSDDATAFAEQPPLTDANFDPVLAWAADNTNTPPNAFQLQTESDSPVRFRVFTAGSDASSTPPELELATQRILERLESDWLTEERLQRSKLEAMAEFAAGAGHEINNPVATIVGRANLLLAEESNLDRRASLATIGAQALRIRDMIGDTMLFARPPKPHLQSLNLADVLPEIIAPYKGRCRSKGVTLTVESDAHMTVTADRTQLAIVVSAILQNALDATPSGGEIDLTVDSVEPSFVRIQITDSGTGLSDTDRIHLFDPFYSGRQAGRGLGFGLSKAWRIVTGHGGRIAVEDSETGGCRFFVDWPTHSE